ncbi:HEPN domain-containing protein [Citrobacter portucalensis]|uniref:HEPN domain-containing protein n=1 Tax=Citrobacter portucalensis TaxID=1639133 RepID=UPI001F3F0743|nr:HEPN domain-containing protein [Citrobacter portucalensis]
MHVKAQTKIKDTIREILTTPAIAFTGRTGHFDFSLYEVLANELNKRKINFKIDKLSCWIIFDGMKKHHFKDKSTTDAQAVNDFVDTLCGIYCETPMDYSIDFHFRNLKIDMEPIDHEFVSVGAGEDIGFGLFAEKEKYVIASIKKNGYLSGSYPSSFIKSILQDLKLFIFLIKTINLIKPGKNNLTSTLLQSMSGHADTIRIDCVNVKYPWMNSGVYISESVGKFLHNFIFNSEFEAGYIIEKINHSLQLMNAIVKDDSKEALRIKAAIDWLVQSEITDDETMSFIQICMGLESIFGDDDYEGGLTNILSDRCAYLIGNKIQERRFIKDTFKKIYQVRSKIVHGVRNHLSDDELYFRHLAYSYLERSILKEIKNLDLQFPHGA